MNPPFSPPSAYEDFFKILIWVMAVKLIWQEDKTQRCWWPIELFGGGNNYLRDADPL